MIGRLTGTVNEINSDSIILDVGGVGYNVFTTRRAMENLRTGQKLSIYIEHYIAENTIKLYGFPCKESQEIAKILVKVKGINYKIALTLLDHLGVNELIASIRDKNEVKLKVKGIGDKLIKRIITETYEEFLKLDYSEDHVNNVHTSLSNEAVSALVKLGFQQKSSQKAVSEIIANNPDIEINDLIKLALKML
ncbi:ruvA domain protein [Neorickettsia helminthoeca str. Oregon]|uniref:Holliday junction branch migration complex subunit RuvA n=1 Tax=Neorickettsia helminthoeca str. Oregon TaxID=1286528 RepID=X5HM49_9RICK|nr:Holliday junction branch migration protein RuvA [Neorickettsia helminthoeca]AHX11495.1 ruvA domain protein [Neorickettsia helminthoeca str. Oregon]